MDEIRGEVRVYVSHKNDHARSMFCADVQCDVKNKEAILCLCLSSASHSQLITCQEIFGITQSRHRAWLS